MYIYSLFERQVEEGSSPGIEYVGGNDTIQEETIQVVTHTHTHEYIEKKTS